MYSRVIFFSLFILFFLPLSNNTAYASLIDNGDGTITQIREDGSQLMWMDGGSATRNRVVADIGRFNLNGHGQNTTGYYDWRLPAAPPVNGVSYDNSESYDGSTDVGSNITSLQNEMAYLFYVELGNLGYFDANGNASQEGWGLSNKGVMTWLNGSRLLTGNTDPSDPDNYVYAFDFGYGNQSRQWYSEIPGTGITKPFSYMMVRTHVVPIPSALWLFVSGLFGMLGLIKREAKKAP